LAFAHLIRIADNLSVQLTHDPPSVSARNVLKAESPIATSALTHLVVFVAGCAVVIEPPNNGTVTAVAPHTCD
jgi:hypothetical protein